MTIEDMTAWVDSFQPEDRRDAASLIMNDSRWNTLTTDEKVTLVMLILTRIRVGW